MSTLKVNAQPTFRLREVRLPGKATPEKGKFRAIITHRETYDTERVIQEMLDRSGHHMSVSMVESVVKELLDTMISLTLNDGATRRFGDYFAVRLDMRGTFEEQDSTFDPARHEVKVSLVPLKKFRIKSRTKPPQNVKKPPRAYIAEAHSETAAPNEIKVGEDIIINGRDLTLLARHDYIYLWTTDIHCKKVHATFFANDLKEHTPTRVVVPYPRTFADAELHPNPRYRKVYVEIFSSGGKPGATWRQVKCHHPPVILGGEEQ